MHKYANPKEAYRRLADYIRFYDFERPHQALEYQTPAQVFAASSLTAADYVSTGSTQRSTGDYYHYSYDAVGNRLAQESMIEGLTSNIAYQYDDANRLVDVDGVPYTCDNNGNLLSDGVNEYIYDSANRLIAVSREQGVESSYTYNGLGDRLSQTVNGVTTNYTLDLNAGLTQVLDDGAYTYTYGLGRISQSQIANPNSQIEYFLGDALGSVRQLTNTAGQVTLVKAYEPYGSVVSSVGSGVSVFGYTGEQQDVSGLVYLRARYYRPADGRFQSRDTWAGDDNRPLSLNRWLYVEGNPVNLTDPTGKYPRHCQMMSSKAMYEKCVLNYYDLEPIDPNNLGASVEGSVGCYDGPSSYRAPGYIEGLSFSLGTYLSGGAGMEIVYDFATWEHAVFKFGGYLVTDVSAGFSGYQYVGIVQGLKVSVDKMDEYSIVKDYGGYSDVKSLGFSLDGPLTPGVGYTWSKSYSDPLIWSKTIYLGATLGTDPLLVIDFSRAKANYSLFRYLNSEKTSTSSHK